MKGIVHSQIKAEYKEKPRLKTICPTYQLTVGGNIHDNYKQSLSEEKQFSQTIRSHEIKIPLMNIHEIKLPRKYRPEVSSKHSPNSKKKKKQSHESEVERRTKSLLRTFYPDSVEPEQMRKIRMKPQSNQQQQFWRKHKVQQRNQQRRSVMNLREEDFEKQLVINNSKKNKRASLSSSTSSLKSLTISQRSTKKLRFQQLELLKTYQVWSNLSLNKERNVAKIDGHLKDHIPGKNEKNKKQPIHQQPKLEKIGKNRAHSVGNHQYQKNDKLVEKILTVKPSSHLNLADLKRSYSQHNKILNLIKKKQTTPVQRTFINIKNVRNQLNPQKRKRRSVISNELRQKFKNHHSLSIKNS